MKTSFQRFAIATALALALVPAVNAAESADQAAIVKEKIQNLRSDCARGRAQIVLTLEELSRLAVPGIALRPQFDIYKAELVRMEVKALYARNRADAMREKGEAFFAEWEQQVRSINNEDIRKEAAKRLAKRKKSYDRILAATQEVKDLLVPFMSDLNDISKLLDSELNAATVSSTKGMIRQAKWHGEDVLESLTDMEKELDRVAAELAKYQ